MNLLQIQIIDDPNNPGASGGTGAGYRPSSSPAYSPAPPHRYQPSPAATPAPVLPPAPRSRASDARPNPDLDEAMGYSRPLPVPPAPVPPRPPGVTPSDPFRDALAGRLGPVDVAVTNWPARFGDGRGRIRTGEEDTTAASAPPAPPQSPGPPPDIYRFKETADRLEAGERYGVRPVEETRPRPPMASPVPQPPPGASSGWSGRPVAAPVDPAAGGAADKEAFGNLFKNFLPKGVGEVASEFGLDVGAVGSAAGLGELAAAAGPAAAAMLAAKLASDQMGKALHAAGNMAVDLAGNKHMGALSTAADAAKLGLMAIPVVGPMAAGALKTLVPVVEEYTKVAEAFIQRGRELQRYNADLAGANARADVRRQLADIKESDRLGESLSRLTENQAETESNLRELLLPIKEAITDMLAELSEVGKEVTGIVKEFAPLVRMLMKVLGFIPMSAIQLIGVVIKQLHDWLPKNPFSGEPDEGALNSIMQQLFQNIERVPGPGAVGGGAGGMPRGLAPVFTGV